jgi:mannose-6-phosphate isomerase class I
MCIRDRFSVYVLDIADEMALPEIDRYRVLSCVDGEATVITEEGSTKIGYLDSLILPASSKNIKVVGNARILLSLRTPNQL